MYNIVGRQASNGYTYYDGTLGPREASSRQGRCPKSEWVCSSRTLQRRRESAGQEWQRQKGGGYWSFLFRRRSGYSIHTSLLCRSLVCPMKERKRVIIPSSTSAPPLRRSPQTSNRLTKKLSRAKKSGNAGHSKMEAQNVRTLPE